MPTPAGAAFRCFLGVLSGLVFLSGLTGCAGEAARPVPVVVAPSDFSAPIDPSSAAVKDDSRPPRAVIDPRTALGGDADVMVLTGAPQAPAQPALPRSEADRKLQVDQLVGQINGRPVYANQFFAPMDERLRREASRMKSREWLAFARKEIEGALWDKLRDELLLAEFQTGLSPEERMGLLAFIQDVRDDVVSGNLGSTELAQQRLLDTEGLDLEAKVKDLSQREFIAFQLRRSIGSRVNVAARDIELYYEQRQKDFAPPPVARFVILRVPRKDTEKIEAAERALGSGEAFESIAGRLSTWRPEAGSVNEVEFVSGEYSTAALFGPAALNEAARALEPGQTSARVDVGADAYWVRLASIEQKPGKSLYEVQREIEDKIRAERVREEERRYFDQLFRRGSFSDVKTMTNRLFEFAAERYLIQEDMKAK
ncbi:MAG: peptidyl-prolyl cis-trans isomerase [Phycisphaerae bacterium]|nr:peptidyl-prolyl cis-trans isomerase [Phycisphaerae bacterium]